MVEHLLRRRPRPEGHGQSNHPADERPAQEEVDDGYGADVGHAPGRRHDERNAVQGQQEQKAYTDSSTGGSTAVVIYCQDDHGTLLARVRAIQLHLTGQVQRQSENVDNLQLAHKH